MSDMNDQPNYREKNKAYEAEVRREFMDTLCVGAEVYWNDPDDDVCSGIYRIVEIHDPREEWNDDTVVVLTNDAGSEVEAYMYELD